MVCPGVLYSKATDGGKSTLSGIYVNPSLTKPRHLMTGTGAYFYLVWGIWLRHCLNYRHDEYELYWPNWFTMPEVVKAKQPANGATKKTL